MLSKIHNIYDPLNENLTSLHNCDNAIEIFKKCAAKIILRQVSIASVNSERRLKLKYLIYHMTIITKEISTFVKCQ